jgi:hypothetical protein
VRAGMGDVEHFRVTVQTFGHLDDRFGGGHARQALIQYLSSDGDRLLRGRYIEAVGSALFSSVAEAAWMTDDSAPRSAVAGLSACGQPDTQAGDALAGRAQREPLERLVGGQLADGRQAVRRCGRQGLRRRFIPRRSGAGTAGSADTAAAGERGWHAGRTSRVLHLHAEPLAQPLEFLVAQRFQPGRAEDRRGGFLVPGADLAQRFGGGHGVIEGVFALHDDVDVGDH